MKRKFFHSPLHIEILGVNSSRKRGWGVNFIINWGLVYYTNGQNQILKIVNQQGPLCGVI